MSPDLATPAGWLPLVFMALMAIAILAYVILDGYDLGVGILLARADDEQKNWMIAAIGPFWDANETWLVLGVGLLLVAFPRAHGVILGALYLPVVLMLIGLSLRGVAFEFRAKVRAERRALWNRVFFSGSLLAALAQGWMLGSFVIGFRSGLFEALFCFGVGVSLAAGYALLGAGFLIMKTDGDLQRRAVRWARRSLGLTALGIGAISIATPALSASVFAKWFTLPNLILLAPIPLMTLALIFILWRTLRSLPRADDRSAWVPFACAVGIFLLAFHGLAFSLYPWLVIDRLTIWDAASAPEALKVILVGALIVLPTIVGYTVYAYRVFWGKAQLLEYT
jgi:cytochrome bd ubiquinol oxidase subunit II